jgi:hypothetical protein
MHVDAMPLVWLGLPIYLAVGVILWRSIPTLRHVFCEAGDLGGMIIFAVIWPFALPWFLIMLTIALAFELLDKLFQLFRRK